MYKSRFEPSPIGTICLECGANSVDREYRPQIDGTVIEEITCRLCGYGEDIEHCPDDEM